jgi:hypothetical protein
VKPLAEIPLRPLLRLSPLQPGESLPSLLVRLTHLNYYPSTFVLQRLLQPHWPDQPDCPSQAVTFRRLAALTCIPAGELYNASDHAFVPAQPSSNLFGGQPLDPAKGIPFWDFPPMRGSVRPTRASRFCPLCLKEAPYHRLAWRPVAMSVCLRHNCLLADECPKCHYPVSIQEIVLRHCASCRADLCQANTHSIQAEAWEHAAQATLWGWLTGKSAANPDWGWPNQTPAILCSLAEGLAMATLAFPERFPPHPLAPTTPLKVRHSHNTLTRLPATDIFWAYTSALQCMRHWPEGFREFLTDCVPKSTQKMESVLGFFYTYWMRHEWKPEPFQFIHAAFDTFSADRSFFSISRTQPKISFEQLFAYARAGEAAQILATPESVVQRLGQIGLIHRCRFDSVQSGETFFLRVDLRALKYGWNEKLSLTETAEWLGVSSEMVRELSKEQLLIGERRIDPTEGQTVFFTHNAVARLLERVNSRVGVLENPAGLISLIEVARQLDCIQLNEARLLKRLISSNLRAWRSPMQRDDWGVSAISFSQKEIDTFLNEFARSKDWLSAEDLSADLGVDEAVFQGWVERGLIEPVIIYNGQPYFKPAEIQKFSTQYIFDHEAWVLLGITWTRLLGYIRRGKLAPVAGPELDGYFRYLLPRKKVERLAARLEKRTRRAHSEIQSISE